MSLTSQNKSKLTQGKFALQTRTWQRPSGLPPRATNPHLVEDSPSFSTRGLQQVSLPVTELCADPSSVRLDCTVTLKGAEKCTGSARLRPQSGRTSAAQRDGAKETNRKHGNDYKPANWRSQIRTIRFVFVPHHSQTQHQFFKRTHFKLHKKEYVTCTNYKTWDLLTPYSSVISPNVLVRLGEGMRWQREV